MKLKNKTGVKKKKKSCVKRVNPVMSFMFTCTCRSHVRKALRHCYANQAKLKFDRLPENVYSVDLVEPMGQVSWQHSSEMQSQVSHSGLCPEGRAEGDFNSRSLKTIKS